MIWILYSLPQYVLLSSIIYDIFDKHVLINHVELANQYVLLSLSTCCLFWMIWIKVEVRVNVFSILNLCMRKSYQKDPKWNNKLRNILPYRDIIMWDMQKYLIKIICRSFMRKMKKACTHMLDCDCLQREMTHYIWEAKYFC